MSERDLFAEWSSLNGVMCDYRSRFDVLRERMPAVTSRAEAEALLRQEQYDERYPLLPEWLQ